MTDPRSRLQQQLSCCITHMSTCSVVADVLRDGSSVSKEPLLSAADADSLYVRVERKNRQKKEVATGLFPFRRDDRPCVAVSRSTFFFGIFGVHLV